MNRILPLSLLVVLLLSPLLVFSQSTFQKLLPGSWNTWGTCAKRSSEGNLTFCTWAVDQFDSSGSDVILVSFDDQGDTLWTRSYGGPYDEQSFSLLTTGDGGYLITGTTNTTEASNGPFRGFLIKTDEQGDTIWTRAFSGLSQPLALTECYGGGFVVLGWQGPYGMSMLRIDTQGDLIWSRYYDRQTPPDFESEIASTCIVQSTDSSYFVGGIHSGGMFFSKVDPSGMVLWAKVTSMGGEVRQMEATPNGGLALFGYLPSETGIGWDGVLIEMDSSGNTLWSKGYDSSEIDGFTSGIRTSDNGFSMIGSTQGVDPYWDVHLLKTDSAGEVLLSRTFDGGASDVGRGIVEADDGGSFILGNTYSFGSGPSMWLIKTDSSGSGDCYQDTVTIVVSDVELDWIDFQLQPFSSTNTEYSTAFGVRSGATILPLCPVRVDDWDAEEHVVQVSPNPANDQFTVLFASDRTGSEIEVFNLLGERVYGRRALQPATTIDCSSLSRGIYLVRVSTATSVVFQKVVLE